MATKAMNIKMDEERLADIKSVAAVFHMSITDVVMDALDEYLPKMKNDRRNTRDIRRAGIFIRR